MFRPLFLLFSALLLSIPALDATSISGQIDLEQGKARRPHLRYGGANLSEIGPPAPFVGVVYLTSTQPIEVTPPLEPAVMEQKGLQFYPAVLPILKGTSVSFPNQDNTYHNVFSYSPEKRFDLGRYAKNEEPPLVVFEKAGEVRVFCEVHEHMRAIVLVLDTPYFAATDTEGSFELTEVPSGDYTLNIWRMGKDLETRPVTIGSEPLVIP